LNYKVNYFRREKDIMAKEKATTWDLRRIIFTVITVIYVAYLVTWVWWFFVAGNNISMVFATFAKLGGAKVEKLPSGEAEFDTTTAGGLGKGSAIVARGGGLVDFLFFLLILTLTFIIERAITHRIAKGKMGYAKYLNELSSLLEDKKIDEAIKLSEEMGGVFGRFTIAGLKRYKSLTTTNPKEIKEELQEAFDEQGTVEGSLLERRLIFIATIASIATMTGLLGTVVGMIRAFAALSAKGRPDPNQLATGISEALINTAGGLTVAIISIIFYNYFVNSVDMYNYNMEEISQEVVENLEK
jgi:biopolymer transport protein ExbB